MRKIAITTITAFSLALGACGSSSEQYSESVDVSEDTDAAEEAATEPEADVEIPVQDDQSDSETPKTRLPQIAYSYRYGYSLAFGEILDVQEKHASLCRSKGAEICNILEISSDFSDSNYGYASLQMTVAADKAIEFAKELGAIVGDAGGNQSEQSVTGEDLSKQIVDTEARLRTKKLLADRLTEILRTNNGGVAELVEAERQVNEVLGEIERTESQLADMKGRVRYSTVTLNYKSSSRGSNSFWSPINEALSNFGYIFAQSIAFIFYLLAALIPVGLIGYISLRLWRFIRRKKIEE